jgi:hypothetical protein
MLRKKIGAAFRKSENVWRDDTASHGNFVKKKIFVRERRSVGGYILLKL